ncbi:hypothetical protein GCM10010330_79030 [Streptomyces tendae]|nr:hypothetical protein GCM10010330_79030 [Streptomyces tendae]
MRSQVRAPKRSRNGRPSADLDASPTRPAVPAADPVGGAEAAQLWVGAWTAMTSGYGPGAASFL